MDEPICVCGHVRDEHDGNVCTIEGCACVHFETEDMVDGDDYADRAEWKARL
jgi:hypothetical protein